MVSDTVTKSALTVTYYAMPSIGYDRSPRLLKSERPYSDYTDPYF